MPFSSVVFNWLRLSRAIAAFVEAEPRLAGYEILQAFSSQRHRKPHFLLSLKLADSSIDQTALVAELQKVLKKVLLEGEFYRRFDTRS